MIGVFSGQHMGQRMGQRMGRQARTGTAPLDRVRWQRRLRECFTARTCKTRPHDPVRNEPSGDVFQFFGRIFPKTTQRPATLGAVVVASGQLDLHAWHVIRDQTPLWLVLWLFVGKTQLCRHLCDSDLAGLQRQLQVFNAFRRRSKPVIALARQMMPQLLDQDRLRLHLGRRKRREPSQFIRIFW